MASSTYKGAILIARNKYVHFPAGLSVQSLGKLDGAKKVITNRFEEENARSYLEAISQLDKGKHLYLVAENSSSHTCRESLLAACHHLMEVYKKFTLMVGDAILFVDYFQENGVALTKSRLDKIHRIINSTNLGIFLNNISLYVEIVNETVTFHMPVSGNMMKKLWIMSYLMYIFRREELMDYLLEHLLEVRNVGFFQYMTREFLSHAVWGDSSNPGMIMSMAAYAIASDGFLSEEYRDGPAEAVVSYLSYKAATIYAERYYIPLFNFVTPNWAGSFACCSVTSFRMQFESILRLKKAEKELEVIAQRRTKARLAYRRRKNLNVKK